MFKLNGWRRLWLTLCALLLVPFFGVAILAQQDARSVEDASLLAQLEGWPVTLFAVPGTTASEASLQRSTNAPAASAIPPLPPGFTLDTDAQVSNLAELMTALRKADAAGDTAASQRIAAMIRASHASGGSGAAPMLNKSATKVPDSHQPGGNPLDQFDAPKQANPYEKFLPKTEPQTNSAAAMSTDQLLGAVREHFETAARNAHARNTEAQRSNRLAWLFAGGGWLATVSSIYAFGAVVAWIIRGFAAAS